MLKYATGYSGFTAFGPAGSQLVVPSVPPAVLMLVELLSVGTTFGVVLSSKENLLFLSCLDRLSEVIEFTAHAHKIC